MEGSLLRGDYTSRYTSEEDERGGAETFLGARLAENYRQREGKEGTTGGRAEGEGAGGSLVDR